MLRGAITALNTSSDWLGAFPGASLTLVDPPWRTPAVPPDNAVVMEHVPWWTTPTSMAPELAAARAVSRRFWAERIDTTGLPGWFVDALAEYMARRAVTILFAVDNTAPGYAFLEQRYFGGFVPRFVRIRLLPESDGALESAYRHRPAAAITDRPSSPADAAALAGKALLTLATLERWLGRPVFDQVVTEFASASPRPTLADFARTASAVSGQQLSWLFDETLASSAAFDYGVGGMSSERQADGRFVTEVVVRRFGGGLFTGSASAPIGAFESGRGVVVSVRFADGSQHTDTWDGRAVEKVLRYRSTAEAVSAVVDPDRVLLLDRHQTNNSWSVAPRGGASASRWAIRWTAWLEHALLTCAALV
jgi:hypothetical protein